MPIQRALQAYRHEKHNCAQSIYRGFQKRMNISEDTIRLAKALGGGWAPDGRCGALHAALELTPSPDLKNRLTLAFVARTGAESCRDIKKYRKLACEECVRIAAEELERITQDTGQP